MALPMGTVVMLAWLTSSELYWPTSERTHTRTEPVETRSEGAKEKKRERECVGTLHEFIKNGKQTLRWKKKFNVDWKGTEKAMFGYPETVRRQLVMSETKFVLQWGIFQRVERKIIRIHSTKTVFANPHFLHEERLLWCSLRYMSLCMTVTFLLFLNAFFFCHNLATSLD